MKSYTSLVATQAETGQYVDILDLPPVYFDLTGTTTDHARRVDAAGDVAPAGTLNAVTAPRALCDANGPPPDATVRVPERTEFTAQVAS